jgi:hypothetical protein
MNPGVIIAGKAPFQFQFAHVDRLKILAIYLKPAGAQMFFSYLYIL